MSVPGAMFLLSIVPPLLLLSGRVRRRIASSITARLIFSGVTTLLVACAAPAVPPDARVLIFGEQHDQPDQQRQVAAEVQALAEQARRMALSMQRSLDRQGQHLDQLAMAVLRPAAVLSRHQQGLQALQGRLLRAALEPLQQEGLSLQRRASRLMAAQTQQLTLAQRHWDRLRLRHQAQDPAAVLQRGYAWVSDAHGAPLTSALQAVPGQALTAVWHDGRAQMRVESVHPVTKGDSPRRP